MGARGSSCVLGSSQQGSSAAPPHTRPPGAASPLLVPGTKVLATAAHLSRQRRVHAALRGPSLHLSPPSPIPDLCGRPQEAHKNPPALIR